MAPRRLIDVHLHHPATLGMDGPAPREPTPPQAPGVREAEDALIAAARAVGAVRLCVNSFGIRSFGEPPEHGLVEAMVQR